MTDRELLDLINEYLTYNPLTGVFRWKKSPNRRIPAGRITGQHTNSHGYKFVFLKGTLYAAHRLAWLITHKEWPDQIDHMNGCRDDNRMINLRSVSSKHNTHNQRKAHKNNSTGFLGVVAKQSGRFAAEIKVAGKKLHLGTFNTAEEASVAYKSAKTRLHEGAIP